MLKKIYFSLDVEKLERLQRFHIVNPNFYIKTKLFVARNCFNKYDLLRKVTYYDTIVRYLESYKYD